MATASSASSIKYGTPIARDRSQLNDAAKLSALYGGINYDQDAIENIYKKSTQDEYAAKRNEYDRSMGQFYNRQATAQNAQIDTQRKLRDSAIMSGSSRAMQGMEEFRALQAQQQATSLDNTTLVQQQRALADQEAAAMSKAVKDAMTYADLQKSGLMANAANLYASDTQYDVGLLGANSMIEAANTAASGQGYVADRAYEGNDLVSQRGLEGTKYSSDKSAAASGYAADKAYAGQVAYANGMVGAANASAAGQIEAATIEGMAGIKQQQIIAVTSVVDRYMQDPSKVPLQDMLNVTNSNIYAPAETAKAWEKEKNALYYK